MLRDLKSKKPFLLIQFDGIDLDNDQKYLLSGADFVGHEFRSFIYICYPERIMANDKRIADSMRAVIPFMSTPDTCLVDRGSWYVDHFDSPVYPGKSLFGSGAMRAIGANDSLIRKIDVHPSGDGQLYEFSCWFLLDNADYRSPYISLHMFDSTGNDIDSAEVLTKVSVDSYNMWFRANKYFNMKANCRQVSCRVYNEPNPSYIALDELMLRPADAIIVSKGADGKTMVNNHLLK